MVDAIMLQKRHEAVAAYRLTHSFTEAGRRIGRPARYVAFWVSRMTKYGNVNKLVGRGRPSTITKAASRRAQVLILRTQSIRLTTQKLKAEGLIPASTHHTTVYRHLVRGKTAVQHLAVNCKPLITDNTAHKRKVFARHHANTNWDKVLFTDSKYFYVSNRVSGKQWVLAGTRPMRQVVKRSAAVHVYAGFSARGVTPLIEVSGTTGYKFPSAAPGQRGVGAAEYQHVLTKHLLPAGRKMFGKGKWQLLQDGAPPHRAATTTALLASERVQVIELWPGNSPDLNPIENLWAWVVQRLRNRTFTTIKQLRTALKQVWAGMPASLRKNLANSMRKRLELVKENDGQYTGY